MFENLSVNPVKEPALFLSAIVAVLTQLEGLLPSVEAEVNAGNWVAAVLVLVGGLFVRSQYTPLANR